MKPTVMVGRTTEAQGKVQKTTEKASWKSFRLAFMMGGGWVKCWQQDPVPENGISPGTLQFKMQTPVVP